jgi:protein TonB
LDYASQRHARRNPLVTLSVVLLHVLLLWGIQAGMTQGFAQRVVAPVHAMLLEMAAPEPLPLTPSPPPPPKSPTPPAQVTQLPRADSPVLATPPAAANANAITVAATNTPPAPVAAPPLPVAAATVQPAPVAKPVERSAPALASANCEKPEYPMVSRRKEEEGTVYLKFLIGVDGQVQQSEVEKSSGFRRLDEAARAGLAKCKFKPATVDGVPVDGWANMKYVWRLE